MGGCYDQSRATLTRAYTAAIDFSRAIIIMQTIVMPAHWATVLLASVLWASVLRYMPIATAENTALADRIGTVDRVDPIGTMDVARSLPQDKSQHESQYQALQQSPQPSAQFPSFNSQVLDQQIIRYRTYVQMVGVPDILIVGSSRAIQGIDPIALQQALQQRGYGQRRVYNLGINGATAQVVAWLLRELLPPEQLPRLVVWADGSRAFNSGRNDRTYAAIRQSPGYQAVQAGSYPTRPAQLPQEPEPELSVACVEAPSAVLSQVSVQAESPVDSSDPSSPDCPPDKTQRPYGDTQPLLIASDQRVASGFAVVVDRFVPNLYYQRFPRVPGAYDGDYRAFTLQGPQSIATVNVAKYLRSRGIPLILVNLPLTDAYLDRFRQQREAEFRAHMLRLAQQQGFWFRNLDRGALKNPQYFADPSHLNQVGAVRVAEYLAQDATIPWWR